MNQEENAHHRKTLVGQEGRREEMKDGPRNQNIKDSGADVRYDAWSPAWLFCSQELTPALPENKMKLSFKPTSVQGSRKKEAETASPWFLHL